MVPRESVCPDCGEPVDSTVTSCSHCGGEFDAPALLNHGQASTGDAGDAPDADESVHGTDDPAVPEGSARPNSGDHGATGRTDGTTTSGASDEATLVGAHVRLAAGALTVVVGLIPTLTLVVVFLERPPLWLLVAIPGLLGVAVGILVDRQDASIDAVAKALYAGAASFVLVPIAFFVFTVGEQTIHTRLTFALVFGLAGCSFAIPVCFVGWRLQPD